ncbi:unnamed protein product [Phytophthora fragariaefolia]|uniref:Unnamed protein product n=1 Tax=Phytophthora fragariaefolia TaxID=1490495 RepID=A0A9W6Y015_9STRA|nr:unnamed protein product [Phytophthora fragariaefolia]
MFTCLEYYSITERHITKPLVTLFVYGRFSVLPLDVVSLNLGTKWKSNEVAQYRRRLYKSLRDSRHLVERQLLKAQDRRERRLEGQVAVEYEIGDPVWVYQTFRARRRELQTKKLAYAWHGPYRIVGKVYKNAYKIDIPSHPNRTVTVNVNRLKPYRGKWTRPYMDETPEGLHGSVAGGDDGPLTEADLPVSSFAEWLTLGGEDTVVIGVYTPLVEVIAKRNGGREVKYLVVTSTYETLWLARGALMPQYAELIVAFEEADRKKKGLPELKRGARLADANAQVDDEYVLLVYEKWIIKQEKWDEEVCRVVRALVRFVFVLDLVCVWPTLKLREKRIKWEIGRRWQTSGVSGCCYANWFSEYTVAEISHEYNCVRGAGSRLSAARCVPSARMLELLSLDMGVEFQAGRMSRVGTAATVSGLMKDSRRRRALRPS